ncbi:glutamine synthetase III [Candidatus Sumerlaeota bacterium]|nr:glutamine synthetase III [Candidatus Sumerlaeota bacterium]
MPEDTTTRSVIDSIADCRPMAVGIDYVKEPISEIFGCNVFSGRVMKERLPKNVFERLLPTLREGEPLDPSVADVVANAMKDWAIERGATHYTHWFHPMTGSTAEKHDAFIDASPDGGILTEFSGKMLIKGEPDASSFPSGGIRSTFEARGYTAWDPTSPAFLMENVNGRTLCIPTAFCSYTGEALDRKTPLLRSIEALSNQCLRVLRLFGNDAARYVSTTVGPEQEYFLIDKKFYLRRPDLVNAGRTLYGSRPPKGQEMEDHYFGAIRPRILAFMMDCERKLYKLGIPVKTRHNEVSPAQFEIAPIFESANIATDHNMLVMETLRSTAEEHGLVCLLHEKPFVGVNGSGKHNNWSMCDSQGNNLLEPGDTPHENAQFLVFLTAVLRAVHKSAEILRIGVAGAGNDHRLGANEAPPAILSVYLGEQLTEVMENIIEGKKQKGTHGGTMQVGVTALPPLPRDATDRNRTSPFAFTGNKFEFRAVGSSQSISPANIAINVAVASALDEIATDLEGRVKKGESLNSAVQTLLQNLFTEHRPIVFNGDNYSKDWPVEAERRGLPNLKNSVDALARFSDPEIVKVFSKYAVLSKREILSRQEILLENYATTLSIEAQIAAGMGRTMILPAAIAYQKKIADSMVSLRAALGDNADVSAQKNLLEVVTNHISRLKRALSALDEARSKADEAHGSAFKRAKLYRDTVLPIMQECRESGDMLEHYVEDSMWPIPKYREMLWIY